MIFLFSYLIYNIDEKLKSCIYKKKYLSLKKIRNVNRKWVLFRVASLLCQACLFFLKKSQTVGLSVDILRLKRIMTSRNLLSWVMLTFCFILFYFYIFFKRIWTERNSDLKIKKNCFVSKIRINLKHFCFYDKLSTMTNCQQIIQLGHFQICLYKCPWQPLLTLWLVGLVHTRQKIIVYGNCRFVGQSKANEQTHLTFVYRKKVPGCQASYCWPYVRLAKMWARTEQAKAS